MHSVLAFTYPILHFNGYLLLLIRYGRVILIYMATPDEDSTGVSIPKRGRPSLGEKICRIGLRESVYNRWLIKKEEAGYKDKSKANSLSSCQKCLIMTGAVVHLLHRKYLQVMQPWVRPLFILCLYSYNINCSPYLLNE